MCTGRDWAALVGPGGAVRMSWAVLGMKWAALGGSGVAIGLYWVVLVMNWTVLGGTGGVEWAVPTFAHHCLQPISARDQGVNGST